MLILVNENDIPTGYMEKLEAHEKAMLHRAFSVCIFNSQGMLLLQQRALSKYHTPGLWTNSCCSHPQPDETAEEAALRRLNEEMGLTANLKFILKFSYRHKFDNNLTEHEVDHVFVGYTDSKPVINTDEVNDYAYISLDDLKKDIDVNPDKYTPWFKIMMNEHYDVIKEHAVKKAG